jgi:hypothetical protein
MMSPLLFVVPRIPTPNQQFCPVFLAILDVICLAQPFSVELHFAMIIPSLWDARPRQTSPYRLFRTAAEKAEKRRRDTGNSSSESALPLKTSFSLVPVRSMGGGLLFTAIVELIRLMNAQESDQRHKVRQVRKSLR